MAYRETRRVASPAEAEKQANAFLDRFDGPAEPSASWQPVKEDEPEGQQDLILRHWGNN